MCYNVGKVFESIRTRFEETKKPRSSRPRCSAAHSKRGIAGSGKLPGFCVAPTSYDTINGNPMIADMDAKCKYAYCRILSQGVAHTG